MPLFKIENLTYYYPEREKPALQEINLAIEEGEFILVAGGSGSGKSSLARLLAGLLPDFYGGRFGGKVYFQDWDMRKIDRRKLAREVGMVFQDPEKQLVMTSVEAEIAFGLENLGLPREEMFRRVAEVASFLGLTDLRQKFTANLSGGEKQKLALAAVLAMQPRALILDEPTSQLDPVVAEDFLNLVKRLNEEMGFTIVLIEQRLERCFHLADRVLLMEDGQIVQAGSPEQIARWAGKKGIPFLPPVVRLFAFLGNASIPITIKEGRKYLRLSLDTGAVFGSSKFTARDKGKESTESARSIKQSGKRSSGSSGTAFTSCGEELALAEVKNLWFAYPDGKEVLQDISFQVNRGEFVVILGGNGAGKSTFLKNIAGLLKPGRGKVILSGHDLGQNSDQHPGYLLAYLSQNPNDYLYQDTVENELLFTLKNFGLRNDGIVDELLEKLHIDCYRRVNPRDLSSGERLRVALASVLVTKPRLILLDEPTRGIDYRLKDELGRFLLDYAQKGAAIVLVTHDVEFAAEFASRVTMMFAGRIISDGNKSDTLGRSLFYSTQICKLLKGLEDEILTFNEAVERIGPPLLQVRQVVRATN